MIVELKNGRVDKYAPENELIVTRDAVDDSMIWVQRKRIREGTYIAGYPINEVLAIYWDQAIEMRGDDIAKV